MIADFQRQTGSIFVQFDAYDRIRTIDSIVQQFEPDEELVDTQIAGRHMGVRFISTALGGDFRVGRPLLEGKPRAAGDAVA